jgi:hypothetical protein
MKLYFNGCSHTWGDDLIDRDRAWPALMAKKLQCDFVNDSMRGGTNDRIMYRTIKHAHEFDRFYIAWTYTTRFTRYRADNNHDVNFNPQLKNTLYGDAVEFKDYGRLHYVFWHNELYSFKLWLQNIILLQRYLESINKSYVMINADHNNINRWSTNWNLFNSSVQLLLCFDLMDDEILYNEHLEIQTLLKQIDTSNYIGWDSWWITKLHSEYPVGSTGHLLEDGHAAVANTILAHDSN